MWRVALVPTFCLMVLRSFALASEPLVSDDYIRAKDLIRQKIMHAGRSEGMRSEATASLSDILDPEELTTTNGVFIRDLQIMDNFGWTQASLKKQAWSDSYWPMYRGLTANRYASSDFINSGVQWANFYNYISQVTLQSIYNSGASAGIDVLSPAEKYDLLIGNAHEDMRGYLASAVWRLSSTFASDGAIAKWLGICHGWSPASFMLPRPLKPITVLAFDGHTPIQFYPSDVKALGSNLWGMGPPRLRYLGGRCTVANPAVDENGRILDENCFDVNPGIWHAAVVNEVGIAKRNLIIDVSYDYQVWNQPVTGYSYTYFNVQTQQPFARADQAMIPMSSFAGDKFRKYRSSKGRWIVGVTMTVFYLSEVTATHTTSDDPSHDVVLKVTYNYDLELDAQKQIIGGEWYQLAHPDFMWLPSRNAKAASQYEGLASSTWDGTGTVPVDWAQAARAAARDSIPLARIVDELFTLASKP